MYEELEKSIIRELSSDRFQNSLNSVIPPEVISRVGDLKPAPQVSTRVLYTVHAIASGDIDALYSKLLEDYDAFSQVGVLPAVFNFLISQSSLEALECLAYCKFERAADEISSDDLEIPHDLDFGSWNSFKEHNSSSTSAGQATMDSGPQFPKHESLFEDRTPGKSYFTSHPWILQLLVSNPNKSKKIVDQWWPLVIPSLLNLLDTTDIADKARATRLVSILAQNHYDRLSQSGLVPIFESSVEPCLSYLSPLVDTNKTMLIHRSAVMCLGQLANGSLTRLNYIAREGCLKSFLHTRENVSLTIYFMETLEQYVEAYLKSLTVVHLHSIIKAFNQIMCDPFIDYSPPLINASCSTMATVIKWTWPRVDKYKYTILLGLAKADALDTECCKLLRISDEELVGLKKSVQEKNSTQL